jgi:hypothetical protein
MKLGEYSAKFTIKKKDVQCRVEHQHDKKRIDDDYTRYRLDQHLLRHIRHNVADPDPNPKHNVSCIFGHDIVHHL